MKERPILFSGPMVRAILDGRKTVTRRVVKPQPVHAQTLRSGMHESSRDGGFDCDVAPVRCPYGVPGDRLYVRETWCLADPDYARYPGDGRPSRPDGRWWWYAATEDVEFSDNRSPWKPSIHMPKEASRILLEVVSVRVERLQEITDDDAVREGATSRVIPGTSRINVGPGRLGWSLDWSAVGKPDTSRARGATLAEQDVCLSSPRWAFASLWNEINEARGFGWDRNPYVWRVEFRRLEVP